GSVTVVVHTCDAIRRGLSGVGSGGVGSGGAGMTGISLTVALAVLGSAVIHASWNAIAKAIDGRLTASVLVGTGHCVFGGLWCVIAPIPDAASWPYLLASAVLQ